MAFANTIGEKKARDIASFIVAEGKRKGVHLPALANFVNDGLKAENVFQPLEELNTKINHPGGVKINLEDSIKIREYFESIVPTPFQIEVLKKAGKFEDGGMTIGGLTFHKGYGSMLTDIQSGDDSVVRKASGHMATGGVTFEDKVDSISKSLVGKPVPRKYIKEYGEVYTEKTAKEAATKIAGAIKREEGYAWGGSPISSGDVTQPVFESGGSAGQDNTSVTIDATKLAYQIQRAEKRKDKKAISYLNDLKSVSNEIGKMTGKANPNIAIVQFGNKTMNVPVGMIQELSFAKGGTTGNSKHTEQLAKEYSRLVKRDLTEQEMKDVADGKSHPDDYMDANMTMHEAFINVTGKLFTFYDDAIHESEKQNQRDTDLISAASAMAKKNRYYINEKLTYPRKPEEIFLTATGKEFKKQKVKELGEAVLYAENHSMSTSKGEVFTVTLNGKPFTVAKDGGLDNFAKGGSVKKRFSVFLATEMTGENYDNPDYETDDYNAALKWAKEKSKQSHPKKPKGFKYSDYDYVANIFDNVSNKLVADFADGESNYVDTPEKVVDKKYYLSSGKSGNAPLFGSRSIAMFYTEGTKGTNDLMEVIKSENRNANIKQVHELIGLLSDTHRSEDEEFPSPEPSYSEKSKLYSNAIPVFNKWKEGKDLPTQKAGQMAMRLWFGKIVKGVEMRGTHYAKGGSVKDVELPYTNLWLRGFGMDINGNHVVKVGFANDRSFSIQTNGVLLHSNTILRGNKKLTDLSPLQLIQISHEIYEYVSQYGSKDQKKRIKKYESNDLHLLDPDKHKIKNKYS